MAKDLAACGISARAAFHGEFKYPSVWILDSAISVLACEAGLLDAADEGGYCPIECADLWDWPPGWAGGELGERFNLIATWFLCAVCLQKWSTLSQAAWHCVGSLFDAPL
eukprot:3476035-Amphidinium_carterae.1